MSTLLEHEWTALSARAPRLWWLAVVAGAGLVFVLANRHWPLFVLGGLAWAEASLVFMAFGQSMGAVRREWRDGTGHLWLRLRTSAAARLAAKGLAVLALGAVRSVGLAVVGALVLLISRHDLAVPGLAPGLLGAAPTSATVLDVAQRWLPRDLGLLFALAPPLAAFGLALGLAIPAIPDRRGHRRDHWRGWRGVGWLAFLVLFWAFVNLVAPHVPPLFTIVHRPGGEAVVHFTPVGSADVEVGIAPHVAFTLWPFFLLWALAAVVFAAAARYLAARTARA